MTLNTNVTSRLTASGFLEALLLIDEPHSGIVGSTPTLLACGAAGSNDNGSGVCPTTGDGTGRSTYNGSAGHANVFQGQPIGANEIVWKGVPFDSPGLTNGRFNTRIVRLINVRANAGQLPLVSEVFLTQIVANVSITPGGVALTNPQQTVALFETALAPTSNPVATLNQCVSANPGIATDPTQPSIQASRTELSSPFRLPNTLAPRFERKTMLNVRPIRALQVPRSTPPTQIRINPGTRTTPKLVS